VPDAGIEVAVAEGKPTFGAGVAALTVGAGVQLGGRVGPMRVLVGVSSPVSVPDATSAPKSTRVGSAGAASPPPQAAAKKAMTSSPKLSFQDDFMNMRQKFPVMC